MTVVFRQLAGETPPDWPDVTTLGVFAKSPGDRYDRHFHDCVEYWLVISGRARIAVGADVFEVASGDIVRTEAGVEHDVLAADDSFAAYFLEGATPSGGRVGHLHRTSEAAAGHPVERLDG
jgi:quercetin dioxygenase-like cupin family protein